MARDEERGSPGHSAFWEALGLTLLLFLVFALRDGLRMTWLLAGALPALFLVGWGVLYLTDRLARRPAGRMTARRSGFRRLR